MNAHTDPRIWDKMGAVIVVALIASVLVGATSTPARAQTTKRVSVASDDTQGGLPAADSFVSLSGVNLPWINYGHDVGLAHTWEASHDGFSSNVTRLRADLEFAANHRVKLVRLFIFCDLRGGIVFDDAGVPQSFDEYVHADFQTLLDEASRLGLRLIPVLFDYTLADGVTTEVTVGEHPQLITDPARRDELLAILRPFLAQYGSDPTIYAWDVVSEPKYATACEMVAMRGFVVEVADLIREVAPEARVTLGCGDRGELPQWTDVGLDLYQFHYYDWMEPHYPLDFPAADLGLDRPVIVGEITPTEIAARLDLLRANGYAGVLFWSLNRDHSFRDVAGEYRDWVDANEHVISLEAGLQMVSVPLVPANPDPAQLGFDVGKWARWYPAISDYVTYDNDPLRYTWLDPAESVPGKGYWARFAQDTEVSISGLPPSEDAYVMQLSAGWTQIGNPRLAEVPWSITGAGALMVRRDGVTRSLAEAQAAGWCEDFAWAYRPGAGYELVFDPVVVAVGDHNRLEPWQGYWFLAHQPVELIFPSVATAATAASRPRAERAEGEWLIRFIAALEDGTRAQAVFGQAARSRQMELPPSFGSGVQLSIVEGSRKLGVDLREQADAPVWTLEAVASVPDARVTLQWPNLSAAPHEYRPMLVDMATGKRTYMRTSPGYSYTSASAGEVRRFEVRMAPSGAGSLAVTAAAVAGGGNVELRVTLSAAATVDAEVLNIAGRQVGTVCRGREMEAGAAVVLWDAVGDRGTRLPGGRYLVRVTARADDGQQTSVMAPLQLGR